MTPTILPLRICIGAISAALIAASYPIALYEGDILVAGMLIRDELVRVGLYSALHVAGWLGIALTMLYCEAWLVRLVKRRLNRSGDVEAAAIVRPESP